MFRAIFACIFALCLHAYADDTENHVIVSFLPSQATTNRLKGLNPAEARAEWDKHDRQTQTAAQMFIQFYMYTHPGMIRSVDLGFGLYNYIFDSPESAREALHAIPKACAVLLAGSPYTVLAEPNRSSSAQSMEMPAAPNSIEPR